MRTAGNNHLYRSFDLMIKKTRMSNHFRVPTCSRFCLRCGPHPLRMKTHWKQCRFDGNAMARWIVMAATRNDRVVGVSHATNKKKTWQHLSTKTIVGWRLDPHSLSNEQWWREWSLRIPWFSHQIGVSGLGLCRILFCMWIRKNWMNQLSFHQFFLVFKSTQENIRFFKLILFKIFKRN